MGICTMVPPVLTAIIGRSALPARLGDPSRRPVIPLLSRFERCRATLGLGDS